MRLRAVCGALAACWLLSVRPGLAAEPVACTLQIKDELHAGGSVVTVDWCGTGKAVQQYRLTTRVDDRSRVTILSKHFNFLHYGLEYKVEDRVVEAYVTLEKLWSQVFGLGGLLKDFPFPTDSGAALKPPCATLNQCLADWYWMTWNANVWLDEVVGSYQGPEPGLTEQQTAEIHAYATAEGSPDNKGLTVPYFRKELKAIRDRLMTDETLRPASVAEIELLKRVDAEHAKTLDRMNAFVATAGLIRNGQRKVIDKRKAGTITTVSLLPRSRVAGTDSGTPVAVEYFVHSRFPLTYHMGYGYSRLKDVDFDKVRALDNQDLFSQVKNQKDTSAFAAFLSYQLKAWPTTDPRYGVYATLGTDFESPGKRLYMGGSILVRGRLMVDVGYASDTVKEGQNKIVEQIGDRLGTRELYDAVTTRRQWEAFFGISVSVF